MRTQSVRYEKCFNLGNYEHEKIAIEVLVEDEDNVQEVIKQARNYVELQSRPFQKSYENAERIVNDPDSHTGYKVKEAMKFLEKVKSLQTPEITHMTESYEKK